MYVGPSICLINLLSCVIVLVASIGFIFKNRKVNTKLNMIQIDYSKFIYLTMHLNSLQLNKDNIHVDIPVLTGSTGKIGCSW